MIDFRYFLVSIAAIFLALAVGVALGAGPLKGQFDSQLRDNVEALGKERDAQRSEIEQLKHTDKYRDDVVTEIAPALVDGKLSGRRVVVVALPGADGKVVKGIRELVAASDAEVTGTVQVTDKWADPAQRQFLDDMATQLVTADVKIPEQGTPYDRVGALLARAVVSKDAVTAPDTAAQRIMSAFGEGDLVKADAGMPRADLAVVVAPPVAAVKPDEPLTAEAQDQARNTSAAWVALTRGLDEAG